MSYSNWRNTSGWGAIYDPTGVLTGNVLVATAGATSYAEDYVTTVIGSSISWGVKNYRVQARYAWPANSDPHPMRSGSIALIARAGTFAGNPADAQSCYLGEIDFLNNQASIIRRNADISTVLRTSTIDASIRTLGKVHSISFDCYAGATSAVRLALAVNGTTLATVGDFAFNRLKQGEPGLRVASGTAYVDDFSVFEYTASGSAPTDLAGLAGWWKADSGLTVTGTSVSAWTDSSTNTNNAAQVTLASQPLKSTASLNSLDSVTFEGAAGTTQFLTVANDATLDFSSTGMSMFVVAFTGITNVSGSFVSKDSAYALGITQIGSENVLRFIGNSTVTGAGGTTAFDATHYSIFEIVGDRLNAGTGYLGVNGFAAATFANIGASTSVNPLLLGTAGADTINGGIAEVLVYAREVTAGNRQRIEGYLANKWGLQIYLPDDHPFRNAAPTT